jgi:hypothetical protein
MPTEITHEEFLSKLRKNNEYYRNGEFEVIGEYKKGDTEILLICEGIKHLLGTEDLLKRNSHPNILSAIDKTAYFKKQVFKNNRFYRNGEYRILGEYKSARQKITIEDSFGKYSVICSRLLYDYKPTIYASIDREKYVLDKIKRLRKDFEKIDYSFFKYKKARQNCIFRCKIHDYKFEQRIDHHLNNVEGCIHCMKKTIMYSSENIKKHKKYLTNIRGFIYVFRLSNEKESFYKVGITSKKTIDRRIKSLGKSYEIVVEYMDEGNMVENYELEQRFLKEFINFKYVPKIRFKGYTECLTINPVQAYYKW